MDKYICVFTRREGKFSESIRAFLKGAVGYQVVECAFEDEASIREALTTHMPRCIVIDGHFGEGDEQIFAQWLSKYIRELSFYKSWPESIKLAQTVCRVRDEVIGKVTGREDSFVVFFSSENRALVHELLRLGCNWVVDRASATLFSAFTNPPKTLEQLGIKDEGD
ncbi:MAG: hypothetical protein ACNFW9_00070 [Candidatus Kerfeldbacteria bacterium]